MAIQATVGIIANPAAARDVRRIVAHGGAVTTHDKLNQLHRVLVGLAGSGVDRVISMSDRGGITAGLRRLTALTATGSLPTVEFIDHPITHTAHDTTAATRAMVDARVGAIVVLGGDGTNGIVADASGEIPLVSISTGTNNAFPRPIDPTVAGLAAGLCATRPDCRDAGTYRSKKLSIRCGDRVANALVDVAIVHTDGVGSGAIWDASSISELFLSFAEPDSIGLSAIGGHLRPVTRRQTIGLHLTLDPEARTRVNPPIGPGLIAPVGVDSVAEMTLNVPVAIRAAAGIVAVDGQRMFRFGADDAPSITLRSDGPIVVDAAAVLDHAARHGLLATTLSPAERSIAATTPIDRHVVDSPNPQQNPHPNQQGDHHATTQPTRPVHRNGAHSTVRIANPPGVSR